MDNWDMKDGMLHLVPLLAWESATAPTMALLRLSFARSPEDLANRNIEHLQVGIMAEHAKQIGEELLFIAEQLSAQAGTAES